MKKLFRILIFSPAFLFSQTNETDISDTSKIKIWNTIEGDTNYMLKNRWQLDGHWIIYYEKSKKSKALEVFLKNGKSEGIEKYWYRNGQLKEEDIYSKDRIDLHMEITKWYPDAKLMARRKCFGDTIKWDSYYHSGQLKTQDISINEKWISNREFCENGQLTATPSNPSLNEKQFITIYYCSGIKKREHYWIAGTLTGPVKEYNEKGKLTMEGQYSDDPEKLEKIITGLLPVEKTGIWKYYDDKGRLIKRETYENGQLKKTEENLKGL